MIAKVCISGYNAVSLGWDAQTGLAMSLLLLGVAIGYA